VGSYESRLGSSALAEVWNGTGWHIRAVPVPPGGTHSALDGVSCTTASCIAVGHYTSNQGVKVTLAERWNGTSWSLQPTPDPAGAKDSVLSGVSCGSATSCMAVGRTYYGRNRLARLVERWNGTAWSIKQASNPRNAALSALSGVSCVASTACVAVGNYLDSSSDDWLTLAEAWNGSTWTVTPSPNPAKSIVNNLFGVSCMSATACTAVGDWIVNGSTPSRLLARTLAEAWNGTTWVIEATVSPVGIDGGIDSLASVSCRSPASCSAAGSYAVYGGHKTLSEVWNGTDWAIQPTPSPGRHNSYLAGVSCAPASPGGHSASPGASPRTPRPGTPRWPKGPRDFVTGTLAEAGCTAVGAYRGKSGTYLTLAVSSDGGAWAVQATPSPAGAVPSTLASVSCGARTACTAVGYFRNSNVNSLTLAESWNGTAWAVQRTPDPPFSHSSLVSVSCVSASFCMAVGSAYDKRSASFALAESWNGTAWAIQPTPPLPASGELKGVSCTSATACITVGAYRDSSGNDVPLAESWNGTTWTIEPVPSPTGGNSLDMRSVSCASPSACTAVGVYDITGGSAALAERWNGTTWAVQAMPAGEDILFGVSCATPTTCTAVGETYTFEHVGPLAEEWRNGTWHVDKTPPLPSFLTTLSGVACRSASACAAVGGYINSAGEGVPLAEAWNGSTWSIQPTPAPRGGGSGFGGVSPTSATSFTAVGGHLSGSQVLVTLAETGPG
jgi:hypothetical protein